MATNWVGLFEFKVVKDIFLRRAKIFIIIWIILKNYDAIFKLSAEIVHTTFWHVRVNSGVINDNPKEAKGKKKKRRLQN